MTARAGGSRALAVSGEVVVSSRTDVVYAQRQNRQSLPARIHELDLNLVRLVDLHDRTDRSSPESVLGNITLKNDDIEQPKFHAHFPPG